MQKTRKRSQKLPREKPSQNRVRCEIEISIKEQSLILRCGDQLLRSYPISSSRFGVGTEHGSYKTPLGCFQIDEKIGHRMPRGTVFQARIALGPGDPLPDTEDLITSRILWLDGLDPHNANTKERFIYIHGTKHEDRIGEPASHGCIRMRNADIIELFDLVHEGTPVRIID